MTDTKIVTWLEQNLDELVINRDVTKGVTVYLSFCSSKSGCQVEFNDISIRKVIEKAILFDRTLVLCDCDSVVKEKNVKAIN